MFSIRKARLSLILSYLEFRNMIHKYINSASVHKPKVEEDPSKVIIREFFFFFFLSVKSWIQTKHRHDLLVIISLLELI